MQRYDCPIDQRYQVPNTDREISTIYRLRRNEEVRHIVCWNRTSDRI